VTESDYVNFVLGEYAFITDAKAFSYEGAVDAGLLNSPCFNAFGNSNFSNYKLTSGVKIPTNWVSDGFYELRTVEEGDTIPVSDNPNVSDILNFGTNSALYVDTTRPCEDDKGSLLQQQVSVTIGDECCKIVKFEVEVFNPNKDDITGGVSPITEDDIELYVDSQKCFMQFSSFIVNTNGYVANSCCCEREGDVSGWYVVKGIAIADNSKINLELDTLDILATVLVKPNRNLIIGDCKVFLDNSICSNDVFVVAVPTNAGYLDIDTKSMMIDAMDKIDMVSVRNHILAPKYETFDVKVVFKKDETSILTLENITNSIKAEISNSFLPINRKLGDQLNTIDLSNLVNDVAGVARARVTLLPRSSYMKQRETELGDYVLFDSEFPILGSIIIQ
jgi:hypothetical protein